MFISSKALSYKSRPTPRQPFSILLSESKVSNDCKLGSLKPIPLSIILKPTIPLSSSVSVSFSSGREAWSDLIIEIVIWLEEKSFPIFLMK